MKYVQGVSATGTSCRKKFVYENAFLNRDVNEYNLSQSRGTSCTLSEIQVSVKTRFHAMETESFLEYAFPSHSWSDGTAVCRNLHNREPYFSITIIMQTTKRVKAVLAGQNMCNPILAPNFTALPCVPGTPVSKLWL